MFVYIFLFILILKISLLIPWIKLHLNIFMTLNSTSTIKLANVVLYIQFSEPWIWDLRSIREYSEKHGLIFLLLKV